LRRLALGDQHRDLLPGRKYLTLNFSMETRHLANVPKVMELLEEIEARDLPAHGRKVVEEA
jgi:hypothetical protein